MESDDEDERVRPTKRARAGKETSRQEPEAEPKVASPEAEAEADDEDGHDDEPRRARSPRPYPRLVAHVRRVRQATIAAKWTPLTAPSLTVVDDVLNLAQQPILQQLSGANRRQAHAADVLRFMSRRISRKLNRGLPFPPASMPAPARGQQATDGGRESELDFESVLDAKAVLEAQLEPAAHAVELLRREKQKVEKDLEKDYETLRALEMAARSQAREHRGLLKKSHLLTLRQGVTPSEERRPVVTPAPKGPGNVFDALDEQDVRQLAGHVESIRANMRPVEGLIPQLARGRAELQAVLLGHLTSEQYEEVILG